MLGAHLDNSFGGSTILKNSSTYKHLKFDFEIGISHFPYLIQIDPDTPKSKLNVRLYEAFIFQGNILSHSQSLYSSLYTLKTGLPNDSQFFYITDTSEPELSRVLLDTTLTGLQITQFSNLTLNFTSASNLLDLSGVGIPGCLTELQGICLECAHGFQIDFSLNSCSQCADDDVFFQMGRFCQTRKAVYSPGTADLRETYFPSTDKNNSTPNIFFISSNFNKLISNKDNFWNPNISLYTNKSIFFSTVKIQMFDQSSEFSPEDFRFPGYIDVSTTGLILLIPYYVSIPIGFGHISSDFRLEFSDTIIDHSFSNKYNFFLDLPNYYPVAETIIQSAYVNFSDYSNSEFLDLLNVHRIEGHDHLNTICPDNFFMQMTALHAVKCVDKNTIDFGYTNSTTLPYSVIGCMKNCKRCDQFHQCIECEQNFFLSSSVPQCLPCDYNCFQCSGTPQICEVIFLPPVSNSTQEVIINSESTSNILYRS